jgi:hypothetical protein
MSDWTKGLLFKDEKITFNFQKLVIDICNLCRTFFISQKILFKSDELKKEVF